MPNIRTKWHKLVSLVDQDHIYLTAPEDGTAPHWRDFQPKREPFKELIRMFSELPKFVVDADLLEMVMQEGYAHSLLDMQKAELLRAPFPAMIVEFSHMDRHYLTVLRDMADETQLNWEHWEHPPDAIDRARYPFYGIVFRIDKDEQGEYLVLSPSVSNISIQDRDGEAWIGTCAQHLEIFGKTEELEKLIQDTYVKDAAAVYRAMATALLVMHTEGVKHEHVDVTRINKKRVLHNKPAIPKHVVLSIGRVYRSSSSENSDDYEARRSPRPHWRKGHLRTVHYGTNRASIKQVYINPKLVAFKEGIGLDEPTPDVTYIVTK